MMGKMNKFLNAIREADSIGIAGHIRPDGDCYGSCMGLYNYIREQFPEKKVSVYLEMAVPTFSFICRSDEIKLLPSKKQHDLFLALDCGSDDRLGDFLPLFERAGRNIVVDHHISNIGFGQENYIDLSASSTSEIIYTLLEEDKIGKAVGEALYLGIVHDTGVFKHSCTSQRTMEIAGKLMSLGIPYSKIIDETFYQKTYVQNQLLGRCLLESSLLFGGKMIVACVDKESMEFYGAKSHDLDGIIDQLRVTKGVHVAVLIHEAKEHEYKVSLRSNTELDVNAIASYFGGGGHKKAAGCTICGSGKEVLARLGERIGIALGQ